jgi:release factor glutamine methyltransferase
VNTTNKTDRKLSKSVFFAWLQRAIHQAAATDVREHELEWLLQTCAGLDRLQLRLLRPGEPGELTLHCSLQELDHLWQRRLGSRCPVQYLAGRVQWRDFELTVGPGVLIPRPETEQLVDLAIAALEATPELARHPWADIGTGSGAIALGLARLRPDLHLYAVDCSPEALAIARTNIEALGLRPQVTPVEGRWLEPLPPAPLGGLLSNPPYIPGRTVDELAPEVRLHEPRLALDGGEDGLDAYRVLIPAAAERLVNGGFWAVEHMAGQGEAIADLLRRDGSWDDIRLHHDYAGHDRFVSARRR